MNEVATLDYKFPRLKILGLQQWVVPVQVRPGAINTPSKIQQSRAHVGFPDFSQSKSVVIDLRKRPAHRSSNFRDARRAGHQNDTKIAHALDTSEGDEGMARKRYIKPEFFKDIDMADLTIEARYVYAGMWPWMDRQGVIEADARVHRANIFPHDEKVTVQKVQGWLNELIRHGFVIRFSWQGKDLLLCPTFSLHQRLFPDEQARFNVSDELLKTLVANAGVPAQSSDSTVMEQTQSLHGTVQAEVEVEEKERVKVEVREEAQNFDFESLYKAYPRHEGKGPGLKRIAKQIGGDTQRFEAFSKAVRHYAALCDRRQTPTDKIKMFSSFVGNDRDKVYPWLDYIERPKELDRPSAAKNAPAGALQRDTNPTDEFEAIQREVFGDAG